MVWDRRGLPGVCPRRKRHVKSTYASSTPVTDGEVVSSDFFGSQGRGTPTISMARAALDAGSRAALTLAPTICRITNGAQLARRSSIAIWSSCNATSRRARSSWAWTARPGQNGLADANGDEICRPGHADHLSRRRRQIARGIWFTNAANFHPGIRSVCPAKSSGGSAAAPRLPRPLPSTQAT